MKLTNTDNFVGIYEKAINNKFDWNDKIELAKQAGFDFLEISVDESDARLARLDWSLEKVNELRKLLIDKNFYFNSMCLSAHRRFPFGSIDLKVRQKAKEVMHKAIILAKNLGVRTIQIAAYDVYYEEPHAKSVQYFIEGMKWAASLALKYSVTLAFETMDTLFAGTITRCLSYLKQIDYPNFLIYPDLGNLSQFSNDPKAEISLGKDKIVGFHFKDTKPNTFKLVEFGKGTVDFKQLLSHIKSLKLSVPFLIEMWSSNDQNETFAENLNKLEQAFLFYQQ